MPHPSHALGEGWDVKLLIRASVVAVIADFVVAFAVAVASSPPTHPVISTAAERSATNSSVVLRVHLPDDEMSVYQN